MEVPEITLNKEGCLPAGVSCEVSLAIHAASMLTPGAVISGCKTGKQDQPLSLSLPFGRDDDDKNIFFLAP